MKKVLGILGAVVVLVGVFVAYKASTALMVSDFTIYASEKNAVVVTQADYEDDYVHISMATAEGKCVIRIITSEEAVYCIGSTKTSSTDVIIDELDANNLTSARLAVYNKAGFLIKQPLRSYVFAEVSDIPEYSSIEEARAALIE